MQIVINIPEEDYKGICHLRNEQLRVLPEEVAETLMQIANGTPLPKGHGRLGDLDRLYQVFDMYVVGGTFRQLFAMAPTIIEADNKK